MPDSCPYDRAAEDIGNIHALEHVNLTVPDHEIAWQFYVSTLGLTRDPYVDLGPRVMWINAGEQQLHLPAGAAQVLRGCVGLVVPDLEALQQRLAMAERRLTNMAFSWQLAEEHVEVTDPWGNRFRCHGRSARFGDMRLGVPYVALDVAPGTAAGIARFYRTCLGAPAELSADGGTATVAIGASQQLLFVETTAPEVPYDGHHIAIYVAQFSTAHAQLRSRGLITEESNEHQYRFQEIVDPDGGAALFTLEHEVRSLKHPMYRRRLANRNAGQSIFEYRRGGDRFS